MVFLTASAAPGDVQGAADTGAADGSAGAGALPNIVIILTDDQGYADVGAYGARGFTTPNLDRMAEEGIRLKRCRRLLRKLARILATASPTGWAPISVSREE